MYRRWTAEEKAYLEEKWGSVSISSICKRLNRTEKAVKYKAFEMKLGAFIENGTYITLSQLWFIIGHDHKMSSRDRKYLVLNKKMPCRKQQIGKRFVYVVEIDDFWEWAERNKDIINFSKMEENILGMEPNWVKEQRKHDYNHVKGKQRWTEQDVAKLKFYLRRDYSYSEIAVLLSRTKLAIEGKVNRLKSKEREKTV